MLVNLIPEGTNTIWECAAGQMRMADRLKHWGFTVLASDLNPVRDDCLPMNYVDATDCQQDCTVSNPPYSLKFDFMNKAEELGKPAAFLIPFDMCGTLHAAFMRGWQAIVPSRRIDFLTPNIVQRINDGEQAYYHKIDEIPVDLLRRYSSSDFHSTWVVWKFNLPQQFVWVDLSLENKKTNI